MSSGNVFEIAHVPSIHHAQHLDRLRFPKIAALSTDMCGHQQAGDGVRKSTRNWYLMFTI